MNKGIFFVLPLALGLVACGSSSLTPVSSTETQAGTTANADTKQAAGAKPAADTAPMAETRPSPAPQPEPVRVAAGTVLKVRLEQSLNTERNSAGERFEASLTSPISVDGKEVLPRNTVFHGHIVSSADSGRLKGRAVLAVTLDSFALNGKTYKIDTSNDSRVSTAHKKRNLGFIGGGAGAGALLGGIFGGGKGALIGAGAGAGAGTATAAATGKKHVGIPAETVLSFKLKDAVSIG